MRIFSETKVGVCPEDLEDRLMHFSTNFIKFSSAIIEGSRKYGLSIRHEIFHYNMIVSTYEGIKSPDDYSLAATVYGPNREVIWAIVDDFLKTTSLDLRPADDRLRKKMLMFEMYKTHELARKN